ncbi:MAG TPA: dienelactone hydrolase family protein, partial [Bacteroidia bacterium]|nr:dienelactone hydrolase family protein [Bacteroidia bacterium]
PLSVGLPQLVKSLDSLHIHPYVIVAPQCPPNLKWVDTDWTLPSHRMKDSLSVTLANAMMVLDSVVAHTPLVDTNCLYLTGLSMGGFGAWELAQRDPNRFAAVLPICGGGDTAQAAQLTRLPIWAFHGKKDKLVKVSRTTDMISAIVRHGGKPHVTLYDTIGHLCWNTVYKDLDVIRWLFSNRRNEG